MKFPRQRWHWKETFANVNAKVWDQEALLHELLAAVAALVSGIVSPHIRHRYLSRR